MGAKMKNLTYLLLFFILLLATAYPQDQFTEQTAISLPGVDWGSVEWGDYDSDGDLDIVVAGTAGSPIYAGICRIYCNNGDNTFTEQTSINLPGVNGSSVAWGDYDNDGDLDIILTGDLGSINNISKIFRNNGDNTFTEHICPKR